MGNPLVLRTPEEVSDWRDTLSASARVGCVPLCGVAKPDAKLLLAACAQQCDVSVAVADTPADDIVALATDAGADAVFVMNARAGAPEPDVDVYVEIGADAAGAASPTYIMKVLSLTRPTAVFLLSADTATQTYRRIITDMWFGAELVTSGAPR